MVKNTEMKKIYYKSLKYFLISCIIGLMIGQFITNYVISIGCVEGSSMEPTYYENDSLLVCKIISPCKGDILVFTLGDKCLIKRVIATPGDTILIMDSKVIVNGQVVTESYIKEEEFEGGIVENKAISLNSGEYFVMGDNRNYSYDSRNFGVVFEKDIVGVGL